MSDGIRPLVSVVIPCANASRVLADAAGSAVSRTARVQVIVVDDGSTDGTATIARSLEQVLLIRQTKRGLPAARNRGLLAASGEFVIFLDPCDRLMPHGIDAGLRALAAHPECVMAYGRGVLLGPDGQMWPAPEVPTVRSGHHAALLQTNLIGTPAMAIFRRDAVMEVGGFAEGVDCAADYDLYLRISRTASIHAHDDVVTAYRRHAGATSDNAADVLRDTLTVMTRNRPDDSLELRTAWHEGYSRWQDFYGAQIVEEIRAHARLHEWSEVARKSAGLGSLAWWVLARELGRAARVRHARRATTPERVVGAR